MKPKPFYIKRYHKILNLVSNNYQVEITRHALMRAFERRIDPDIIELTIRFGKIKRFGKNNIKFIRSRIICVGEKKGHMIKIITIQRK